MIRLQHIPKEISFINDPLFPNLFRWRREVIYLWPKEDDITLESTIKWFKEVYIPSGRELYFVWDDGMLIGHVGYKALGYNHFEIDNIIRAVRPKTMGAMQEAIETMMKSVRSRYKDAKFQLETLKYNDRAMNLYKNLGFSVVSEEKVVQERTKVRMAII